MNENACDVLIVGAGVAGLYSALNLDSSKKIMILSKSSLEECDSNLAQGGICMLKNEEDYDTYFEDTMRAGHYENNKESVDIMIRSSQDVIKDLVSYGVDFEKNSDGTFRFTKEGAHTYPRILFHQDITGKEITSHLLEKVSEKKNITLLPETCMVDIVESEISADEKSAFAENKKLCRGLIVTCNEDSPLKKYQIGTTTDGKIICRVLATEVIWACGGIGGLYEHSTNYPTLTGDALGIALKHNIPLQNPDYIQIHPTTLYTESCNTFNSKKRSFLISESVRGEGGILLDKNGKRFTDELQPRDVVAAAIFRQMEKDNTKHVWLSMENIPHDEIINHFKHIYETCLEEGYDCTKEPIPVVPAQHYFMGGVDVNSDSRTSLECLYACGETSCNGVHGKNRLASNSLLESLVFAKRAAAKIESEFDFYAALESKTSVEDIDASQYTDTEKLFAYYKNIILEEINRMRKQHEQNNNDTECRQSDSVCA